MTKNYMKPIILLFFLAFVSCKKDFLDKIPDKSLLVPLTLSDFQAILDNNAVMNRSATFNLIATDDYYTTDDGFGALSTMEQNSYVWAKDIYNGQPASDWNRPYQQIFYANVVLDGLKKVKTDPTNISTYNQIKGSALFYRAFAYYGLVQEFANPYDQKTANSDPGVPLHLSSDVNDRPGRGSVSAVYKQISEDLKLSKELLPVRANYKSRPSKAAAYAMLMRVNLATGSYGLAKLYADSVLSINNKLIDYNTLNADAFRPYPTALPNGNDEVLFYSAFLNLIFTGAFNTQTIVNPSLFKSFENNDLRKTVFFSDKGNSVANFKGSYSGLGLSTLFSGIAVDEILLTRAECFARNDQPDNAIDDINTILQKRYKAGTFIPLTASGIDNVLGLVLTERRKELFSRGLRWTDLRRLNKEPNHEVTLTRIVKGKEYILPPNDKRYVFPIPEDEIQNTGISQNPR
jgi:hypothetical protein